MSSVSSAAAGSAARGATKSCTMHGSDASADGPMDLPHGERWVSMRTEASSEDARNAKGCGQANALRDRLSVGTSRHANTSKPLAAQCFSIMALHWSRTACFWEKKMRPVPYSPFGGSVMPCCFSLAR